MESDDDRITRGIKKMIDCEQAAWEKGFIWGCIATAAIAWVSYFVAKYLL